MLWRSLPSSPAARHLTPSLLHPISCLYAVVGATIAEVCFWEDVQVTSLICIRRTSSSFTFISHSPRRYRNTSHHLVPFSSRDVCSHVCSPIFPSFPFPSLLFSSLPSGQEHHAVGPSAARVVEPGSESQGVSGCCIPRSNVLYCASLY